MSIEVKGLRVHEGEKVSLGDKPTRVQSVYTSKSEYKALLGYQVKELTKLQYRLYADNTYALLLIFQAMDAAGKDSVIRHVLSGINPQGCQVYSFKHPSANELEHDFLWRTSQSLPERGRIGVFNRSYYEEVLIVRVHPEILAAEELPPEVANDHSIWDYRFESIRDHEQHMHRNGTRILKFFLHISAEEQRKRFLKRIDQPHKNWKFSITDVIERQHWPEYMHAYEECLSATSTKDAPWYVIPADDKRNAHLLVAQIILETLESLNPMVPELTKERLDELQTIREHLVAEPDTVAAGG